jgi:hypothetical protein
MSQPLGPQPACARNPHPQPTADQNPHQQPTADQNPHQQPTASRCPDQQDSAAQNPHPEPACAQNPHPQPACAQNPHPQKTARRCPDQQDSADQRPHLWEAGREAPPAQQAASPADDQPNAVGWNQHPWQADCETLFPRSPEAGGQGPARLAAASQEPALRGRGGWMHRQRAASHQIQVSGTPQVSPVRQVSCRRPLGDRFRPCRGAGRSSRVRRLPAARTGRPGHASARHLTGQDPASRRFLAVRHQRTPGPATALPVPRGRNSRPARRQSRPAWRQPRPAPTQQAGQCQPRLPDDLLPSKWPAIPAEAPAL